MNVDTARKSACATLSEEWTRIGANRKSMAMKRVMVVDDEENIGRSLRLILEREGYAVSTCMSVAEAKAQSQRADAYLVDVRLPDGSGIDLVRWMKANAFDAPILMISGHGTIAD